MQNSKGFIVRYAIPLCLAILLSMIFMLIYMKVDRIPLLLIIKNYYIQ